MASGPQTRPRDRLPRPTPPSTPDSRRTLPHRCRLRRGRPCVTSTPDTLDAAHAVPRGCSERPRRSCRRNYGSTMSANHLLCWNARGLNTRARQNVIRTAVTNQRASIVCLQESKTVNFSVAMNLEISGFDFDYLSLPADGIAGGPSSHGGVTCGRPLRQQYAGSPSRCS